MIIQPPVFQILPHGRVRLLQQWFTNTSIIPEGFESDLGTIPRSFWWFLHPNDITYSSIIHDYEWFQADLGKFNYYQGNLNFLKNAIELDKIKRWKAYTCFIVLELLRVYKRIKYGHE